jgi:hypothetical protein
LRVQATNRRQIFLDLVVAGRAAILVPPANIGRRASQGGGSDLFCARQRVQARLAKLQPLTGLAAAWCFLHVILVIGYQFESANKFLKKFCKVR